MQTLTIIQKITIWAFPLIFAITLHEAAHAYIANRCGDTTAKMLGRLSLNPIKHIDLIGTILVPIFIAIVTQFHFVFGWAKPVPINWQQLRQPRRDMALVAFAGPGVNFMMALIWAGCLKFSTLFSPDTSSPALFLLLTSQAGILINLVLAYINLIPVPPLDGSRIVASLLPPQQSYLYLRLEPYGLFILLILLFTGMLGWLVGPLLYWSLHIIQLVFNL
ncbi:site-2 protease family protein [Legionella impletisoli]|uniref:Peptidase M50 n=1 Tax=Legionella impletisoli TaxID=343510 RepID=A0A917JQ94_9GAMM|nr:site-2 protease family protein [Legionella impletisoli]GGI79784.1 peptidase M50 [Legionella impletisoli]